MKTTKDGFVWKLVNDKAKEIFNSGLFELYELHDNDGAESLIETAEDLNTALKNGSDIGIEVGFVERKIEHDRINNLELRSDLENDNIKSTDRFIARGFIGNKISKDDNWAIDVETEDGDLFESYYLYTSEFEYRQDLKTLKLW